MLATSGAFTSRKLQRQAMKAGKRVGGTGRNATGRVRALRRTRSAQVIQYRSLENIIIIYYNTILQLLMIALNYTLCTSQTIPRHCDTILL